MSHLTIALTPSRREVAHGRVPPDLRMLLEVFPDPACEVSRHLNVGAAVELFQDASDALLGSKAAGKQAEGFGQVGLARHDLLDTVPLKLALDERHQLIGRHRVELDAGIEQEIDLVLGRAVLPEVPRPAAAAPPVEGWLRLQPADIFQA